MKDNKQNKKKRISIYERTPENDIRYRGPLSYRHLLILGWICIAFLVASFFLKLGARLDPSLKNIDTQVMVCDSIGGMAVPMFLLSNFTIILDRKQSYKALIIKYASLSLLIVLLYALLVGRYLIGIVAAATGNYNVARDAVDNLLMGATTSGSIKFNLFIDLLLCTLFIFFVNYEPKKYFQGKKKIIFRLFALIPVFYEISSFVIRFLFSLDKKPLPIIIFPFLTTKAPMSFVLFVILVLHMKGRERKFLKKGKTAADFKAYQKTNINSLRFSIYTSVTILITAVIDFIFLISFPFILLLLQGVDFNSDAETLLELFTEMMSYVMSWGIGGHVVLIAAIPFIMLYSYTRKYKNSIVDIMIPVGGVVLSILVGLESSYRSLSNLLQEIGLYLMQMNLF